MDHPYTITNDRSSINARIYITDSFAVKDFFGEVTSGRFLVSAPNKVARLFGRPPRPPLRNGRKPVTY
jgi:hypothetical protein